MKTMFVANSIDCTIKTQQIVRETPNHVVCEFENQQWYEKKDSDSISWHDSYEKAKLHLINNSNKQLEFYHICMKNEIKKMSKLLSL